MSFQQFLQTEIQPERTVTGPDAGSFLASAVNTGLNVFQQAQETGQKAKFAGEVQRIINLNEELVAGNVPQVKRNERLRKEISSSFADDPESNLELRKALGSFGIGAGLAVGRSGAGAGLEAPVDVIDQQVKDQFNSLDRDFVILHTDPNKEITIDVMSDVIKKYRKHTVDQQEAQDLMNENTGNQIADARSFGIGNNKLFETFVGPSIKHFEKELDAIDISSSQGVAKLEALRAQGLSVLSNFEGIVANSFSERIAQMTDKDAIFLLEKQRDAQFDKIKRIRDNLFSPDSQLDILQQRTRFLKVLTSDYKMDNAQAFAVLSFAREALGDAAMSNVASVMAAKTGTFLGTGGNIEKMFASINDNLNKVTLDPETATAQGLIEDVAGTYDKIRDLSNGTLGTGDKKSADNAYSTWLATTRRFLDDGAHVDDLDDYLKDSEAWNEHWELLSPEQNEVIKARQDELQYRIAIHQDSWINSEAMNSGLVQWSPEENKFVAKRTGIQDDNYMAIPTLMADAGGSFGAFQSESTYAVFKAREAKADKYNSKLEGHIQAIIRRRKRDTGQDITREQALQFIPVLRKPATK